MIKELIELIFPPVCGICGKISQNWICPKCHYKIKNELKYFEIQNKEFKLFFMGLYENNIRKLLLKYKFSDSAYLSNLFMELILKNKEFTERLKKYDYIIPVPMFYKNKKIRGYNQTELLTKKMQEKLNVEYCENILIKIKQNKRQSELSEKERKINVKNVYTIQDGEKIKGKNILLVDDIYTTGNTIKECMKELKKAKPNKIDAFVIAKRR